MNAPASTEDPTTELWPETIVYGKQGAWPTEDDELTDWRCLGWEISSGGGVAINLERDLPLNNTHLEDRKLTEKSNWNIEVWKIDPKTGKRQTPLCCGEVMAEGFTLAVGDETESATAIIPPNWSGTFCLGQLVYDPSTGNVNSPKVKVDFDLEFNPRDDNQTIISNRHPRDIEEGTYPIWIDPESARTQKSREYNFVANGAALSEWTLRDILLTLTKWLNPDEEFVIKPELPDDFAEDAPPIQAVTLPRGRYLSDYLTMLLPSFGYDWFYRFEEIDGRCWPVIRIFTLGDGGEIQLPLDAIHMPINKSALEQTGISISIQTLRNKVYAQGALEELEVTVPLYKGWSTEHDDQEDDFAEDASSPVGRMWIANEGGDYTGLRPEIDAVPNFGSSFIPKRRALLNCLHVRDREDDSPDRRRPALVEFRLSESVDDPWMPLTGVSDCRQTPGQIGIWFEKQEPKLYDQEIKIRVTGTIRGDKRVQAIYDDTATSVNGREFAALINDQSQFHKRTVSRSGDFTSALTGPSEEVNDAAFTFSPLPKFADRIGEIQRAATVGATPQMKGLRLGFEVGLLVVGIANRELSFNCLSLESQQEQFPQITSIRFEVGKECRTYVTLMPYSANDPDGIVRRGRR